MKQLLIGAILVPLGIYSALAQVTPKEEESEFVKVDVEPIITTKVNPAYPKEAMEKNLEGMVWLKVFVSEKGIPTKAEVVKSTEPLFDQAAIDAALQFRFTPAKIKDKPVALWVAIPFKFALGPKRDIIKKNSEELPKKIKNPTALVIAGPRDLEGKISYPSEAVSKRIEGAVYASVTLNERRGIKELKIKKGIGGGCDEAVLNALSSYNFRDDAKLDLEQHSEGPMVSIVVQFILPSK